MPLAGEKIRASDITRVVAKATDITSNVGPTSGTTPLDVITAPAFTPPDTNRRYMLVFHCRSIDTSVTGDQFVVEFKEGATILNGESYWSVGTGAGDKSGMTFIAYVDGPTAASHTYKVTITRTAGTGTATVDAGGTFPIQLAVHYVGKVTE